MSVYADFEEFVQTHRPHGDLTWRTNQPTPKGYSVEVTCPCGVAFVGAAAGCGGRFAEVRVTRVPGLGKGEPT